MTIIERQIKADKFLSYFDGKEFKNKELVLSQSEKVVDLPKFIRYHIAVIKRSHNKRFCKPLIKDLYHVKKKLEL